MSTNKNFKPPYYNIKSDYNTLSTLISELFSFYSSSYSTSEFVEFAHSFVVDKVIKANIPIADVFFHINNMNPNNLPLSIKIACNNDINNMKSFFQNRVVLIDFFSSMITSVFYNSLSCTPSDSSSLRSFNSEKVASILDTNKAMVLALIKSGKLPAFKLGSQYRVDAVALHSFILANSTISPYIVQNTNHKDNHTTTNNTNTNTYNKFKKIDNNSSIKKDSNINKKPLDFKKSGGFNNNTHNSNNPTNKAKLPYHNNKISLNNDNKLNDNNNDTKIVANISDLPKSKKTDNTNLTEKTIIKKDNPSSTPSSSPTIPDVDINIIKDNNDIVTIDNTEDINKTNIDDNTEDINKTNALIPDIISTIIPDLPLSSNIDNTNSLISDNDLTKENEDPTLPIENENKKENKSDIIKEESLIINEIANKKNKPRLIKLENKNITI